MTTATKIQITVTHEDESSTWGLTAFASGRFARTCDRCGGSGNIQYYAYNDDGVCYGCSGQGYKGKVYDSEDEVRKEMLRRLKRQITEDKNNQAKAEAHREEYAAQQAEEDAKRLVAEQALHEKRLASKWLDGMVTQKITFTATKVANIAIETQWGNTSLVILEVDENTTVKCFTESALAWKLEKGEKATITATIKELSEYDGFRQTIIARPKIDQIHLEVI